MASGDALETATPGRSLQFLDLPREVQKDIFSHCSQSDLICLSLVSRHFHDLAAAQLYRNFHIVFPDEDDPNFDSPIDGLAGGLDTFVTSEYDYARHLRDLSLDTLSAGAKAEAAYKPYLYSVSCGKFLNSLLLMTLRKATSLESLRWNIRVELSRPVYKALHNIKTLRHLHLRLQAGPSLYEAPPPLPFSPSVASSASSSSTHLHETAQSLPPPPAFTIPGPSQLFYVPASNAAPPPPPPKPAPRPRAHRKSGLSKEPPTLSGFTKLKALSVLDIDSLDVVTELKTCVRNSSSTLTKLKLSFSDQLGQRARRPPPDLDPDESDPEDEFQVVPVAASGPDYGDDISGPAKAFRAQEEKKSQESVLGRIFDVEPYVVRKAPAKKTTAREVAKEPGGDDDPAADPGLNFINAIRGVSNKLMRELSGPDDLTSAQQEILDVIETAARKYVASEESKAEGAKALALEDGKGQESEKPDKGPSESSSSSDPNPGSAAVAETEPAKQPAEPATGSLFDSKTRSKPKDGQSDDVSPEDIDIEEPEEQLSLDAHDTTSKTPPADEPVATEPVVTEPSSSLPPPPTRKTDSAAATTSSSSSSTSMCKAMGNLAAQRANFRTLMEKLAMYEAQALELHGEIQLLRGSGTTPQPDQVSDAERRMRECGRHIHDLQKEIATVEAEIDDAHKQIPSAASGTTTATTNGGRGGNADVDANSNARDAETRDRQVSEYLRSTRGLALRSLAVYLIPVKASVLSRAVDLRVLRRITLLNVGSQAPIWAHLHRENKESPLALHKLFTDNVSTAFLTFAANLAELSELLMLERDYNYRPESFAPRTAVTMSQIRRTVLKKHASNLKVLMIKNMANTSWDLDEKATLLLCRRAKNLQELACNMGIKVVHTFMQSMSGLPKLRALHIIKLRNDDTCVWVMRETKKFLIDNLTHHPEMRLEWLSIDDDDHAERILRRYGPSDDEKKAREKKQSDKAKGKQKAGAVSPAANTGSSGLLGNPTFPLLPALDSWNSPGSDSDDDGDDDDGDYDGDDDGDNLKLETITNIHFCDVWGVRVFKKEVTSGRL